jgi:hypothetical protein
MSYDYNGFVRLNQSEPALTKGTMRDGWCVCGGNTFFIVRCPVANHSG